MNKQKITHQTAICQNCGWSCDDYTIAKKKAAEHAKKTGHRVIGETAIAWSYN